VHNCLQIFWFFSDQLPIFFQVDVDGDGTLSYGEFMTVSINIRRMTNDKHLHKAFAFFDKNKSGFIEIEELTECLINDLGPNHEEVINAIVRDVDTNKVS
jgi:calcium-dependent protein kinase